jgi:AcrR family transcriptional regulator
MSEAEKTKKQFVVESAARLFRDKGYSATSMRDLAQAVNLKASSLYNYIQSKSEILREICFANAHRFIDSMTEVEQLSGNAREKIEVLLRLHIQVATQDVTSVMAFNDEWRHLEEPYLSEFVALRRDYENRFRAIIEQGMRQGEFKVMDSSIPLFTLFSAVRWIHDWYKPNRSVTSTELENEVIRLLLEGMQAS